MMDNQTPEKIAKEAAGMLECLEPTYRAELECPMIKEISKFIVRLKFDDDGKINGIENAPKPTPDQEAYRKVEAMNASLKKGAKVTDEIMEKYDIDPKQTPETVPQCDLEKLDELYRKLIWTDKGLGLPGIRDLEYARKEITASRQTIERQSGKIEALEADDKKWQWIVNFKTDAIIKEQAKSQSLESELEKRHHTIEEDSQLIKKLQKTIAFQSLELEKNSGIIVNQEVDMSESKKAIKSLESELKALREESVIECQYEGKGEWQDIIRVIVDDGDHEFSKEVAWILSEAKPRDCVFRSKARGKE